MKKKIKVGITGESGFIGGHLKRNLSLHEDLESVPFNKTYFQDQNKLEHFVNQCDAIIHTAALNRHNNEDVIYKTNVDLVYKLTQACVNSHAKPTFLFTSSTQVQKENLYGASKKEGRRLFENWAENHNGKSISLIIPNVFGPFGKPNYNSFIATFCHELVQGGVPTIIQDNEVDLIYVQELCEEIIQQILNNNSSPTQLIKVKPTASKKVSQILTLLKEYKSVYMDSANIPTLQSSFELHLFNTFRSYIPLENNPQKYVSHKDTRGAFVEIMRSESKGQTSFSTTVPGVTRGNHFHTRKIERFAVIKGEAKIRLRKIDDEQVHSYYLNGNEPAFVDMPIWYTHHIENIGDSELVTLFWINEPFDPNDPDTFFLEVE